MNRHRFSSGIICFGKCEMGGLSIFLAIVLVAVVISTGLLVDIARVGASKNQAARALDVAAVSVLAGYETDLKNEYGLYALHMPVPDPSALIKYIGKNLSIYDGEFSFIDAIENFVDPPARLYSYRIENASLMPGMPLSDLDVIERQILEYMKYRAPAALATGVADMIAQSKTAAKMADATKVKVEINRKLAQIGDEQQKLRDYLYGDIKTTGTKDKYILNFNKSDARQKAAESIEGLYADFADAVKNHYDSSQSRGKSGTQNAEFDKNEKDLIQDARKELQKAFNILIEDETKAFLDSNRKAVTCVETIASVSGELETLYEKLDECMAQFDDSDTEKQFSETIANDAERGKESLIDAQSAREKIDALNGNLETITLAANALTQLSRDMFGYSPPDPPLNGSDVYGKLFPDVSSYDYEISYDYARANPVSGAVGQVEFAGDRISELLDKGDADKDKKLSDIGVDASKLPSGGLPKWWEVLFSYESDYSKYIRLYGAAANNKNADYNSLSANFGNTDMSLDGVANFKNIFTDAADYMRNMFYTGEYALAMFNNSVKDNYRWAGLAKPAKTAFFDAEAEYLLHGKDKQSDNIFWTKTQLLILRFTMNFIHANSDPEKLDLATKTATLLTSWWSAGSLVPAIAEVILAAWSAKEAIADAEDLLDGQRVPFIKLAGDWKTNVGVSSDGKPKTADSLKWSYIDYLRLLLLTTPRETKLARIGDLIEINTKYAGRELKVKDLYCEIRSELTVSVNYLFMTAAFMPRYMKTEENRHILNAASVKDLF